MADVETKVTVRTLPALEALERLSLTGLEDNLFSSPGWIRVLVRAYRARVFVKYLERAGRPQGKIDTYVFYTEVRNFLEWKVCVLSYCDYCDAHISSPEDWRLIFGALQTEYPGYRIVIRSLRDEAARQSGCFQVLSKEYHHVLDLSPDEETLWKNLKGVFRNQVRQATKRGLTARICSSKELWDFYLLHVRLRKQKYGIFAQPFHFFQVIWEEFMAKGNGFLLGAFLPDGKMVGATLYLVCGDTLYYKINTSSRDALEYRSNNLLLWEGIRLAKERGLKFVDLGSSGLHQEGLVAFKDATNAVRREIVHIGYAPKGYRFSQKRILKFYTWLFTRPGMPLWLTRWGSQFIYPFLA
jgi:hypothetical protein